MQSVTKISNQSISRPVTPLARILPLLAILFGGIALAQPFAADGGFDRPWWVGESDASMRFGAAGDEGGPIVYWSDSDGLLYSNLLERSEPQRLIAGRGMRELAAAEVDGSTAVAWARRDLSTGSTEHWISWRGQQRLLLEALQPYELSVVDAPGGPGVLISRFQEGVNRLRLISWDGDSTTLHTSNLSLVRYRAVLDDDGNGYLVWLEGFRDRGAVGVASEEWTAYLARLESGVLAGDPLALGPALYNGLSSDTVLAVDDGVPQVLWTGLDSQVMYREGDDEPLPLGPGTPVGLDDGVAYWAQETSIRSLDPGVEEEPVNVVWSPVTIERGELVEVDGVDYLVWYGPTRGGDYAVYASNDAHPMERTLVDRLAAAMGWSPWGVWQAFLGQLMGAMFIAVMAAMLLTPLVWLGSLLTIKVRLFRSPALAGLAVGAVLLLVLIALATAAIQVPGVSETALFGTIPQLLASLLLAGTVTWLLRRNADTEPMIGVLASACLFLFLSISALSFMTFQAWLELWSFLL